MKYIIKLLKHIKLVTIHKHYVFLASLECGIPFRGLCHDLSKFSPIELFNSAKYYTGNRSPIDNEKDERGYSYAWLHHRGHNPHHWEYWIDNLSSGGEALKMPLNELCHRTLEQCLFRCFRLVLSSLLLSLFLYSYHSPHCPFFSFLSCMSL